MFPTHAEHRGLYAGFWRRAAAFLIDYALIFGAFFLTTVLAMIIAAALGLPGSGGADDEPDLLFLGVTLMYVVAMVAYYVGFETSALQATPGKLLLRILVVDYDGRRLHLLHGLGRYMSGILTAIVSLALYAGYWICAFTPRKQTIHDLVSRTLVVNRDVDPHNPEDTAPPPGTGLQIVIIGGVAILLMGVPLLGILLAIAIPAYQDYTTRAEIAMAMSEIGPLRSAIAEYALKTGERPQSFADVPELRASLPQGQDHRYQVTLENGVVVIRYAAELLPEDGNALGYSFEFDGEHSVRWRCGLASPDAAALTTIAPRYLPLSCRGPR